MSLNRITSCPDLTPEIVRKLKENKIASVLDFISADVEQMSSTTGIPFKVLLAIRTMVLAQYSSSILNGAVVFQGLMITMAILSTGCDSIDTLLDGGLYTTEVTEVYGRPGEGKTQLCLSTALQVSLETQQCVLYIDTGGGFDAARLSDMLESQNCPEEKLCATIERIHCTQAFDVFDLLNQLEELKRSLVSQKETFYQKLKLVVVDSITSVISPILGTNQNGHGFMMHVCRALKMLASEYSLAILVTNNTVKSDQGFKPALGKSWSHLPDTRIFLTKCNMPPNPAGMREQGTQILPTRKAVLDKSNRQGTGSGIYFKITNYGLESVCL